VDDGDAETAARLEDPGRLPDRALHVVDVHERVVGDDEVEACLRERERGGITDDVLTVWMSFASGGDHGGGSVDSGHDVAERGQIAGDPPLPAAEIQRPPARARQELAKRGAVVPVRVVARPASPGDPVRRLALPVPR
jgi:hypothetical protein